MDGFKNTHAPPDQSLTQLLQWWLKHRQVIANLDHKKIDVKPILAKTLTLKDDSVIQVTWLGHSSILLQIKGFNILFDPIFSNRASPFSFIGPKRRSKLPIKLEHLPNIDYIIISHDHYDHLDPEAIEKIVALNPDVQILTPLAYKKWFEKMSIYNVFELDWWEQLDNDKLTFHLTPAQHWCRRTLFDKNQRLWGSWLIETEGFKFYFAGDSGYGDHYKAIYKKFGSIDFSAIPIGSYLPNWIMKFQHMKPMEAAKAHIDLASKFSLGIHWGTFILSDEALHQPKEDLLFAIKKLKPKMPFKTTAIGETIRIKLK